jgi:hypothetical protein
MGDVDITPENNDDGFQPNEYTVEKIGDVSYHHNLVQGCDEWFKQRLGIMTASEMKLVLTATLKVAANKEEKKHLYELAGQRILQHIEPSYISDDMLRGYTDEIEMRRVYSETREPVKECGFITTDRYGFKLGYSPDGLVGSGGLIEGKSRKAKYQIETIVNDEVPKEFYLQLQTGLLITGRKWIDFISYSGGLPMYVKRVYPEAKYQDAIVDAARGFEMRLQAAVADFKLKSATMTPTERVEIEEITT